MSRLCRASPRRRVRVDDHPRLLSNEQRRYFFFFFPFSFFGFPMRLLLRLHCAGLGRGLVRSVYIHTFIHTFIHTLFERYDTTIHILFPCMCVGIMTY